MKHIFSILKNNILEIYIILNILYVIVGSFLYVLLKISMEYFSYGLIALLEANIIVTIFLSIKKYRFNKVDIPIIFILIFGIISTIFAYDQNVALFGTYERNEGLFVICYYFSLFYITTYAKNKKIIIYAIIASGILELFYAVCQITDLFGVPKLTVPNIITGLTTNPNYFGEYMVICLAYCIGLFIEEKNKKKNIAMLLLIYLFMAGLLLSNTLASLVGIGGVLFVLFFYCLKNKKIKKYVIIVLFVSLITLFSNNIGSTHLVNDAVTTKNETVSITKGKAKDEYGNGRIYIWKKTIPYIPKYILHGVGVDNFRYIDNGKPIYGMDNNTIYDKAHNEYLHLLITQGIFCLIAYLCFHFIVLVSGFKNSIKGKEIYLILPVIGYLINIMFSISVIEVAPIFYIAMGLLIVREEKSKKIYSKIKKNSSKSK